MSAPPRRPLENLMEGAARTQPSATNCLSDEELAAFAQGELGPRDSSRVEQHVDECAACATLLHQAMRALNTTIAADHAESAEDWVATFARGTLVAQRYEIRRFIARGGMGEVYEAYDRQLQERVALKTVCASASDSPRAIRAFKAEVQLARRVTHANVCRIYDLGVHRLKNDGVVHFLTMEFVEGETLGQILRTQGALPLWQCERFAKLLLQALAAAHSAGILHRDFKSDNVMVRRDSDGQLTPVILDFGLARHLDERARSSGHAMVGTLTYMAPEQVDGSPLSKATDVYAFGVVWFEMLTGRVPFAGSPQLSALERLTKAPTAPSRFNRQVPKFIDESVLRCLARQPSQRFQSAEDVLAALETRRPARPVPRKPYAPVLAATATVLVGTIGYVTRTEAPAKPNLTVAPAVTARVPAPVGSASPDKAPSPSATKEPSAAAKPGRIKLKTSPWLKPIAVPPTTLSTAPAPASASASSEPLPSGTVKRSWSFGLIPRSLASGGAASEAQKRMP